VVIKAIQMDNLEETFDVLDILYNLRDLEEEG